MDWRAPANGISVVKLQLRCDTEEAASLVRSALRVVVNRVVNDIQQVAEPGDEESSIAKSFLEPLRQATIEARPVDDGWQVEAQFSGNVDVPSIWRL